MRPGWSGSGPPPRRSRRRATARPARTAQRAARRRAVSSGRTSSVTGSMATPYSRRAYSTRQLLLAHVAQRTRAGSRVERVAPAAGAREHVAEDVAAPDGRACTWSGGCARGAVPGFRMLADGVPSRPPARPYGRKRRRSVRSWSVPSAVLEAVLADQRQPAAELAGAARVGHDSRSAGSRIGYSASIDLDRVVGEVHDRAAAGVDAVPRRPAAPRAEQELEEHERPPLGVVAAEADAGVAARPRTRRRGRARSGRARRTRRWRCGSRSARARRPTPAAPG